METLKIENFLLINKVDLTLRKINIFIGPQAQGKSIIAKLIKYFRDYPLELFESTVNNEKEKFNKKQKDKFEEFFPKQYWVTTPFKIQYENENYKLTLSNDKNGRFKLAASKYIDEFIENLISNDLEERVAIFDKIMSFSDKADIYNSDLHQKTDNSAIEETKNEYKEKNVLMEDAKAVYAVMSKFEFFGRYPLLKSNNDYFGHVIYIPAGRSFFANLQKNVFSFLSTNINIDYFLTEFGSIYEKTKKLIDRKPEVRENYQYITQLVEKLLCGKYVYLKGEDFIKANNRMVNLSFSSSGQQESLPIALILSTWPYRENCSFVIEEPEAHLFPDAQKVVVSLIANAYNARESKSGITITTHSPYILSAINNLIQASNTFKSISSSNSKMKSELFKIVPETELINFDDVSAYMINDGKAVDIRDCELNLLNANEIDNISSMFAAEFDKLIEMEYSSGH